MRSDPHQKFQRAVQIRAAALGLEEQHFPDDAQDVTAAADIDTFRRALYIHRPVYVFDSDEVFLPLRVNAITNNTGNRLQDGLGNTIVERHADGSGLNIRWLRGGHYPNGDDVREFDRIDEQNDYEEDARRLQRNATLFNRVYGRLVVERNDFNEITGAWLQYWVFYYYNPHSFHGIGVHEGDWEMIQLRLDARARPRFATYAQHHVGSECAWDDVAKVPYGPNGKRPVVFVGNGSHASYFFPGEHNVPDAPGGDRANGLGWVDYTAKVRVIGTTRPLWLNWPGWWGGSLGTLGGRFHSPEGPKFQPNTWNPVELHERVQDQPRCR